MSALDDYLRREFARAVEVTDDNRAGYVVESRVDQLGVKKIASVVPVSYETAIENGVMTEEQARAAGWSPVVIPPLPLRRRISIRLRGMWWNRPRAHFGPCNHEDCE